MATRAWLAPAAIGLAVAALTAALGPRLIDTSPAPLAPWEVEAERGYVWPFQSAVGENATFLLVAPHGRAAAEEGLADGGRRLHWLTPDLATYTAETAEQPGYPELRTPCCPTVPDVKVQVTAYVFVESGGLLASNAPAADVARFRHDGHYTELPAGNWTMGSPVRGPDGLAFGAAWQPVLAALRDGVRQAPVGGVVTAVVAQHPHAAALGPLYVTLRVDGRLP